VVFLNLAFAPLLKTSFRYFRKNKEGILILQVDGILSTTAAAKINKILKNKLIS